MRMFITVFWTTFVVLLKGGLTCFLSIFDTFTLKPFLKVFHATFVKGPLWKTDRISRVLSEKKKKVQISPPLTPPDFFTFSIFLVFFFFFGFWVKIACPTLKIGNIQSWDFTQKWPFYPNSPDYLIVRIRDWK